MTILHKKRSMIVACSLVLSAVTLISVVPAHAINTRLTTSAMHLANNEDANIDFKLTDSEFDVVYQIIKNHTELSGVDKDETESLKNNTLHRDLSRYLGSSQDEYRRAALVWLINNNVYSRPVNVSFANGYMAASLMPDSSGQNGDTNAAVNQSAWLSGSAYAKKADFYMMLYKAASGVKCSNVCMIKGQSKRNSTTSDDATPVGDVTDYNNRDVPSGDNYWGEDLHASFSGDYYTYVTPDVYELYFKELVDAGVLSLSEFSPTNDKGKGFVRDYNNLADADWNVSKEVFTPTGGHPLGYSVTVTRNGLERTTNPNYFTENKISVIDALSAIADYLRLTEKEISKTEAKTIAYKYGLMYLSGLDVEVRDSVYFLVAKGILNFDDTERILNLSGYLTRGQMYELMYRVANKDARYDFSQIQLTDSDAELADLGFSETKCDIIDANVAPIRRLMSVTVATSSETDTEAASLGERFSTGIRRIISSIFNVQDTQVVAAVKDTKLKDYDVVMQFDLEYASTENGAMKSTGNSYTFNDGAKTVDLNKSLQTNTVEAIKDIKIEKINSGNLWINTLVVRFRVPAASKTSARQQVDRCISTKIKRKTISTVNGISMVEDTVTNEACTLIEQNSIQNLFSDITFLSDKVLLNNKTGVRAIVSTEKGMALVGNTVVKSNNIMVMTNKAQTKKYYNVEILVKLISSLSFQQAGFNNTSNNTLYNIGTESELVVKNVRFSNDTKLATQVYYIPVTKAKGSVQKKPAKSSVIMYNTSSLCNGVSSLIRTFNVIDPTSKSGDTVEVTLIVDFKFIVPPSDLVARSEEWFKVDNIKNNTKLTLQDVIDFETQRPADGTLMADYWDSNLAYTNAIMNFMYGTTKRDWVTCGYIVPQVHACISDTSRKEVTLNTSLGSTASRGERILNSLFFNSTDDIADFVFLKKYSRYLNNGSVESWWKSFVNAPGLNCPDGDLVAFNAFIKQTRLFNAYYGKTADSGSGVTFYRGAAAPAFRVTPNGVVYRAFTGDDRLTATVGSDYKVTGVVIHTKEKASTVEEERELQPYDISKEVIYAKGSKKLKFRYSTLSNDSYIVLYPTQEVTAYLDDTHLTAELLSRFSIACKASEPSGGGDAYAFVDHVSKADDIKQLVSAYNAFQGAVFGESASLSATVDFAKLISVGTADTCRAFWNVQEDVDRFRKAMGTLGYGPSSSNADNNLLLITGCDAGYSSAGISSLDYITTHVERLGMLTGISNPVSASELALSGVDPIASGFDTKTSSFTAFVTPAIFLPASNWEFKGNDLVRSNEISVILDQLEIFTPSINDCVITAAMDREVGATDVNNLDAGTRLIIEDTVWTKQQDGRWLSDPIKNRELVKSGLNNESSKMKKKIAKYFQSTRLSYNGELYPISNYVKAPEDSSYPAVSLGMYTTTTNNSVVRGGILCINDQKNVVIKKCRVSNNTLRELSVGGGVTAKYVTFLICLDDGLKARPINDRKTVYNLCTDVGEGVVGSAAYGLFDEDLDFMIKDSVDVSISSTQFTPLRNQADVRDEFFAEYRSLLSQESIKFAFYIILMVASYMLVLSWLSYIVLTVGVTRFFFEKVAETLQVGQRNLDLFRVFTFGIYTLDSPPTLARSAIISLGCTLIMLVCLIIL